MFMVSILQNEIQISFLARCWNGYQVKITLIRTELNIAVKDISLNNHLQWYQDKNIKMPQEAETHTCISCPPWPMFNSVIFSNSEQFKNNVLFSTKKSLKIPNG
jgi:hypothetical protein